MRKDIKIPKVKDVYVAAVREFNKDFRTHDWNVYIINDGQEPLETVLIVSEGRDDKDITSRMRHSLKLLPAKSYPRAVGRASAASLTGDGTSVKSPVGRARSAGW